MRSLRVAIALTFLALPACAVYDAVKDLVTLSSAISKEFGSQADVNVSAGKRLTVTLKNSDAANLPAADREHFARLVALFAVAHYPKIDSVDTVAVGFKSERGALGVKVTTSSTPYAWTVRELRAMADSLPARPDSTKK